jgi:hypothetical protein
VLTVTSLKAVFILQLHVVMLRTVHMVSDVCRTCAPYPVQAILSAHLCKHVSLGSVSLVAAPARTVPVSMLVSITSVKVNAFPYRYSVVHKYC